METRETITLDAPAQQRLMVLAHVLAQECSIEEAALLLDRSTRQVRRLVTRFGREGAAALVHANRGRRPVNRIADEVRSEVVSLARGELAGFNPVHLAETMAETGGPELSARSVRRILAGEGIRPARTRRSPAHRSRRERRPRAGMLLQVDGSRHAWLEERGPHLSLVTGVDDATGAITGAVFRDQEDAAGYCAMLLQTVAGHGVPEALYSDLHTIFIKDPNRAPTLAEQLTGQRSLTQLGRALEQAGIAWIGARSAPAKGRVERSNGTLQDRLVSELRRGRVATLEAANELLAWFLPRHNARFAIEPAAPEPAWRPWSLAQPPEAVFCFHYPRTAARDATVSLDGRSLALPPRADRRTWAGRRVIVQERLDGSIWAEHGGTLYPIAEAPATAPVLRARHAPRVRELLPPPEPVRPTPPSERAPSAHTTPAVRRSHPWRLYPAVRPR
jgi:transposase